MQAMNDGGERMTSENGGMREPSTGKGAYELVSPFALERIAVWYELGARKYADRNWEKGIPFGRLIQSGLRHMIRWMKGDRSEDHLAAVCWNVMAMMHFEETGQAQEWNNYPAYRKTEPSEAFAKIGAAMADGMRKGTDHPSATVTQACNALVGRPDPYHRNYKIIAVDFDGCLCKSAWPEIGELNIDAITALHDRKDEGDKIILWTCREGDALQAALDWCARFGLKFDAVNANLPEMNEMYGNDSRKIGADEYWDDKAVNVKA
jgi:hypothetical protein